MSRLPPDAAVAMLGVALIHLLPLPGLAGAATLQTLYALPPLDPSGELLLRHRALLFGLLGGGLLLALRLPGWRRPLLWLTLVADLGFLLLALDAPALNTALQRVAAFDVLALACGAWALWRLHLPADAAARRP
jgi:hypothetical protein